MRWQGHLFGTQLLPPKATPLRASGRNKVSSASLERRLVQPWLRGQPRGAFKALPPSTLLPMGQRVHTGSPPSPHTALPCPTDEGAIMALPLSLAQRELPPAKLPCPTAWGAPGIPPIAGRDPGAPNQLRCPIARVNTADMPPAHPCRGVPRGPQPHNQGGCCRQPLPKAEGLLQPPYPTLPQLGKGAAALAPLPPRTEGTGTGRTGPALTCPAAWRSASRTACRSRPPWRRGEEGRARPASQRASEPTGRPAPRRGGGTRRKAATPRRPPHRRPPAALGGAILGPGGEKTAIGRFGQGVADGPIASGRGSDVRDGAGSNGLEEGLCEAGETI